MGFEGRGSECKEAKLSGPLDCFISTGKKMIDKSSTFDSCIRQAQSEGMAQATFVRRVYGENNSLCESDPTDWYFRSSMPSLKGQLGRRNNRCLIGNKDFDLKSDPGLYYVSPKMIARKLNKLKPKRKEDFTVGRISNWKEFVNTRDRKEEQHEVGNKMFKWQVYSRRSKKNIDIDLEKEGMGEKIGEGTDLEECQGLEEHQLEFCQT